MILFLIYSYTCFKISQNHNNHSHAHSNHHHQRKIHVLPPGFLLVLIRLHQILPGVPSVLVGLEQLLPNDIYLVALLVGQSTGLVYDAVHVHQGLRHVLQFAAPFSH